MRYAQCVAQLAVVTLAVGVLAGCGHDAAPTAASDGFTFAPAAKKAPRSHLYTESATGTFTRADGGKLKVKFKHRGEKGEIWVKKAEFEAADGAMVTAEGAKKTESAKITMTVTSGDSFGDVGVEFTPSGTVFEPVGTLTLELRGEKGKKAKKSKKDGYPSEEDLQLAADHITAGGKVMDVVLTTERHGAYKVIVTIEVPSFSYYGLRD